MAPKKENTLYLIINQYYFDAILNGTKKQEYREIKDTNYKKYLETWEEGDDIGLYYDKNKMLEENLDKYSSDPMVYNNGIYPYFPIPYKFLDLSVGYNKERDTLIVAIENIHFETMKGNDGEEARFSNKGERMRIDINGELCIWFIVYTLGAIVKTCLMKVSKH